MTEMVRLQEERDQLLSDISDDFKSLNGFRPRFSKEHLTLEQLQDWHNEIKADIARMMEDERNEELAHEQAVKRAMVPNGWTIGELVKL